MVAYRAMDISQYPDLPAHRTPTSVIPTCRGAICQSIDPLGLTHTSGSERFTLAVRAINKFPVKKVAANSRRFSSGASRRSDGPEVGCGSVPLEDLSLNLREAIQGPTPLDDLERPKATGPSFVRKMESKQASGSRSTMVPPSTSSVSSISCQTLSCDGPAGATNFNYMATLTPDDSCLASVGSIPSSKTNSRVHRMAERVNKNRSCRCCIFLLALICAINIIFFLFAYDKVVERVAASQLALHDSGAKFEAWTKTTVPVYYKVTIFNLTNPQGFMDGDRPRVHELGPYIYRMTEEKVNVTFHDNGTVTYRSKPAYFFEPDLSSGSEDDQLWTVNIPFINAADAVKNNPVLKTFINYAASIHNFETVQHLTVKELLWGHPSNVLDWGRLFQDLPYPHLHFGLLVGFNNSVQESYTMYTGVDDPHKMNAIHAWNGQTKLDFWSGDSCNRIDGTDAGGFSPGVSPTDTLHIFNGQLCRTIPLVYQKSVKQGGIDAYRFVPPSDVFSYGPANPENMCFCSGGHCPPQGVLDMKPCYWGAAIAFSFPHFYQADPVLRHMVRGLRPDPTKHNTEFDIFPDLGIPVRVKLRMQMNVVLDRNQALNRARHFDLIFPIFWFEAGIDSLPTNLVEKLQMAQDLPPLMKTVFLGLCGLLIIVFFILLVAQTVLSWCSSGLSSLRSLSSRGSSPQDTRSNTPDLLSDHGKDISSVSSKMEPPGEGTCRSFERPHSSTTVDTVPVIITDAHTLLPPYKATGTRQPPIATISGAVDRLGFDAVDSSYSPEVSDRSPNALEDPSPDSEACNDYLPPSYAAAAMPGLYTSPVGLHYAPVAVSAEVHHSASCADVRAVGQAPPTPTVATGNKMATLPKVPSQSSQDGCCHQLEHKPLVVSAIQKPVQDDLSQQETHCDVGGRGPLATSSPHDTTEDIQPPHKGAEDIQPPHMGAEDPNLSTENPSTESRVESHVSHPDSTTSDTRCRLHCSNSSTRSAGVSSPTKRNPSRRGSEPPPPLESDL